MANTSAAKLLQCCIDGDPWADALLRDALNEEGGRAFFRIVVERLGDLFEPRLCNEYARLFARAIEIARPEMKADDLLRRYVSIRRPRRCATEPAKGPRTSRLFLRPSQNPADAMRQGTATKPVLIPPWKPTRS